MMMLSSTVKHSTSFEVLVDHADAECVGIVRVLDGHDLSILFDDALSGRYRPKSTLMSVDLPAPFFAQQGMDLALLS